MLIQGLNGFDCADQYRQQCLLSQGQPVFVLRDQIMSESYHCTTDKVEIESVKLKQKLNKNEVRVM